MNYREASKRDLTAIQSVLKQSKLPHEDCEDHLDNFIVIEENDIIIGVVGMERYGDFALLRSVAVLPAFQGRGLGHELYNRLKAKASNAGVNQLFIITETASDYFKNRGFKPIERVDVPEFIKKTKQFCGLCPSSALVMTYRIWKE